MSERTMNPQQFRSFVQRVRQLFIDKHRCDYHVGAALCRIKDEGLWESWPRDDRREAGYASFEEYCDKELGYSLSQAYAKASNWKKLRDIGLDEDGDTFARCMRLGWSKLNVLLRVALDERAVVAWLNDIEGKNLSEMQFRNRIEVARAHARGEPPPASSPAPNPGNGGGGRAIRGNAGAPAAPSEGPTRTTTRGYVGYEVRFESQAALDAFTRTVDTIRTRYGDVGMGRAIEMMAVHYLASAPTTAQGGPVVEIENLVRMIESAFAVKLQVLTPVRAAQQRRGRRSSKALSDGSR